MRVGAGDNQFAKIKAWQLSLDLLPHRQQEAGAGNTGVDADQDCAVQGPIALPRFQCQDVGRQGIFRPRGDPSRELAGEEGRHLGRDVATGGADEQRGGVGLRGDTNDADRR